MFVSARNLLGLTVLLAVAQTISAEYDVDSFCTLVRNGVKLGSIDDCAQFYTCNDGKATPDKCGTGQSFDKDAQTCRIASSVDCNIGNTEPCKGKPDGHITQPGNCKGWMYCRGGKIAGTGECGENQYFYQGQCLYGACKNDPNQSEKLQSVCDIMPEKVYFGSSEACDIWQRCVSGQLKVGNCDDPLVFNLKNGLCDYQTPGMCDRVTGEGVIPDPGTRSCSDKDEGRKKGDTRACNVYYTCNNKVDVRTVCPAGKYYDVIQEDCVGRQAAVPTKGCDRCQGTNKPFVNAVDPECREWLSCKDGIQASKGNCTTTQFFNEAAGACWKDGGDDKEKYAANNGACAGGNDGNIESTTEKDVSTTEDENKSSGDTTETTEDTSQTPDGTTKSTENTSETSEDTSENTEDTTATTEDATDTSEDATASTDGGNTGG